MLDQIALGNGHEVIRLPHYHFKYNPIEVIWAQVMGKYNNTFKMTDTERLTHKALDAITKKNWEMCRTCGKYLEAKYWKEILRQALLEWIIMIIFSNYIDWSDNESKYWFWFYEYIFLSTVL